MRLPNSFGRTDLFGLPRPGPREIFTFARC